MNSCLLGHLLSMLRQKKTRFLIKEAVTANYIYLSSKLFLVLKVQGGIPQNNFHKQGFI